MYDKLIPFSFSLGTRTVGSTFTGNFRIGIPRRAQMARVLDINCNVTTLFTQVTTPGFIRVGTAGNNAKFAELNMGAAPANAAYNFSDNNGFRDVWRRSVDAIDELLVTLVAPTGGTPAGVADVHIIVGFDEAYIA